MATLSEVISQQQNQQPNQSLMPGQRAVDPRQKAVREAEKDLPRFYQQIPELRKPETLQAIQEMRTTAEADTAFPSFDEVLANPSLLTGGTGLSDLEIEEARAGNTKYVLALESAYNKERNKAEATSRLSYDITGASVDPDTGLLKPDIPAAYQDKPFADELEAAVGLQIKLDNILTGASKDNPVLTTDNEYSIKMRQIILDEMSVGNVFAEMGRELAEAGRIVPDLASLSAAGAGWLRSKTFDPAVGYTLGESARSKTEQFFSAASNEIYNFFNNIAPLTFGEQLDRYFKRKYIEKHGREDFEKGFVVSGIGNIALDKPVEKTVITPELGQTLRNFSFTELDLKEKVLVFGGANVALGAGFSARTLAKGAKDSARLETYIGSLDPIAAAAMRDLSPAAAVRKMNLDEGWAWLKPIRSFRDNTVSKWFNPEGAIGNYLQNQKRVTQYDKLAAELKKLADDKRTFALSKGKDSPEYLEAVGKYDTAIQSFRTLAARGGRNPYIRKGMRDEAIMSLGQAGGYEYLSGQYSVFGAGTDISPELGGFVGAISAAVVVPALRGTGRGVGRVLRVDQTVANIARSTAETLELGANLVTIPVLGADMRGYLVDRRMGDLETAFQTQLGRAMTSEEREGVGILFDYLDNFSPTVRGQAFDNLMEYSNIRKEILAEFGDPSSPEYKEAADQFALGFALITNLGSLDAITKSGKFTLKDLVDTTNAAAMNKAMIGAADKVIIKLRQLTTTAGIEDPNAAINIFARNLEEAAGQAQRRLNDSNVTQEGEVKEILAALIADPTEDISAQDAVDLLYQSKINARAVDTPEIVGDIEAQIGVQREAYRDLEEMIGVRLDSMTDLRGTARFQDINNQMETLYDGLWQEIRAGRELVYARAKQALAGEKIDISSAVKSIATDIEEVQTRDFRRIFSDTDVLFSGVSGKSALDAFEKMAKDTLQKQLGMDNERFEEFLDFYAGVDSPLLKKNLTPVRGGEKFTALDIALERMDVNPDFNFFMGDPFEVDEVRRHFRDLKVGGKSIGVGVSVGMNQAIVKSPAGEAIQEARKKYQAMYFDKGAKNNRTNPLGYILNNKRGPKFQDGIDSSSGLERRWETPTHPGKFHDKIIKMSMDILDGKVSELGVESLSQEFGYIKRLFSTGQIGEGVNAEFVVDVANETDMLRLQNLSKVLTLQLHREFADRRRQYLPKAGESVLAAGKDKVEGGALGLIDNINDLNDIASIKVRYPDGRVENFNLFDYNKLNNEDISINKLIETRKDVRKQHDDLINRINADSKTLVNQELQAYNNLTKFSSQFKNRGKFFEDYVVTGDVETIDNLRSMYIAAGRVGKDMSPDEIARRTEEFNLGMRHILREGMFERAGGSVSPHISSTGEVVQFFSNPEVLLKDLQSESLQAVLRSVGFDQRSLAFTQNFLSFFMRAQGPANTFNFAQKGLTGIRPQEVVSRGFSLARGQVGLPYLAVEMMMRLANQNKAGILGAVLDDPKIGEILTKVFIEGEKLTKLEFSTLSDRVYAYLVKFGGEDGYSNYAQELDPYAEYDYYERKYEEQSLSGGPKSFTIPQDQNTQQGATQ